MQLVIDIIRGARAGQRLAFPNPRIVSIGRDPQADVVLDAHQDILASTRHAEVRVSPDGTTLYADLNSSNGSFVNGARVTQCVIQHGAEVELGAGGPLLRFSLEGVAPNRNVPTMEVGNGAPQIAPAPPVVASGMVSPSVQPAPGMVAPPPQPAPPPQAAGEQEHKVGKRTVALIVEDALAKERASKPRSTEFFRTIVDKEVRSKNKGLFIVTILLGVLLAGAIGGGIWFFLHQRKQMKKQKDQLASELTAKDEANKKALARARADTKAQMAKLKAMADKRQQEQAAALKKLKAENDKIKAMAQDKGPMISKKNRSALYLLAHGHSGSPRWATCTAFAVSKRVLGTNSHCVVALNQGARYGEHYWAVQNENPSFKAKVVEVMKHPKYYRGLLTLTPDVGLIKVDRDLPQQVTIASPEELRKVSRGSLMFSFGFPGRLADPRKPIATLVHGRVGRLTRYDATLGTFEQSQLIQHSALSMGGASGSPLFNDQGKVIGVHAGSYTERSSETIFDPASRTPKKIMMARRLGYKFGIRIDALTPLIANPRWQKFTVRGLFAAVKEIPKELQAVDCAKFGRKLATCSKGKAGSKQMTRQCTLSKKITTQSSIFFLRFAKCVNTVRGCKRKKLAACITTSTKKKKK